MTVRQPHPAREPARAGNPAEVGGQARLAGFNGLPGQAARQALTRCCSSARWAGEVAAGRPYASLAGLLRKSDAAVDSLADADLREALSGHPRIGERSDGTPGQDRWSGREQAGLDGTAEVTRQAIADGNAAYEQRFGHIYLVCATGRSAAELLELLRSRLGNDAEMEWRVVRSELRKINRIRLQKLIGDI
jgi:2-oxo-4-hydroxy-4-carboxy-5-ureidoimidazoline decarboxylase